MDVLPIATQSAITITTTNGIEKFFTLSGMTFWALLALVGIITILIKLFRNGILKPR